MSDYDFTTQYLNWLKENIEECKLENDVYRITMPFLDRNNDNLDLYIQKNGDSFIISDDAFTINDLEMSGLDIFANERRKKVFNAILKSFAVNIKDKELYVEASINNLPQRKHMLAQCILKVSDMFYLSKNNVQSIFLDDVRSYLDKNNVRYIPDVSFVGQSRLQSQYDFAIPHSEASPERLIKVVNRFDINTAKNVIFAWNDTKSERAQDTKLYTFIRDTDDEAHIKVSEDAIEALKQYGIQPALWSERDRLINEFAA